MGTMPIFRTALFLTVALSSSLSTTTSTRTTTRSRINGPIHAITKRGIPGLVTNIWANHGVLQATQNNPGVSSLLTIPGDGLFHLPVSGSVSAQPSNGALSSPNTNQNLNSNPQAQSTRVNPNYVTAPQNSGQNNPQASNAGYSGYYTVPLQGSSPRGTPIYNEYHVASPSSNSQVQLQESGQTQNSPITTPYFNSYIGSPSNLKLIANNVEPTTAQIKTTFVQKPLGQHSGPTYSATSQALQVPVYKTSYPNEPKASKAAAQAYAPQYQDSTYLIPEVQSYEQLLRNAQYNVPTVDLEGQKIPLPVLQLQSAQDFPGFAQTVQAHNQPLVLESGVSYQTQPGLGYVNFGKAGLVPQAGNPLPFLSAEENIHQAPAILPVPSSSSTPQFPQYKGATVNTFPTSDLGKPPGDYQALKAQPQLQFSEKPVQPASTHQEAIHQSDPSEEILEDVEIITKNKPTPEDDDDDDEVDEGYKAIQREYGPSSTEEEDEPRKEKYFKAPSSESDFKPSKSFPFKYYDEKFGKYSKLSSKENDKPYSKYKYHSSADDDDDYDGHSSRIRSDYTLPKPRRIKYSYGDEEEEEESQKNERREKAEEDDEEENEQHETSPKSYRDYGYDFDREFEESYKRDLPKNKYVHVKEVPDIEEPTSHSHRSYANRDASKSSKSNDKGRSKDRDDDGKNEDNKGHGSHAYTKYWSSPKISSKDSEGYGTGSSYKKAPKVIHEDSYDYATSSVRSLAKPDATASFLAPSASRDKFHHSKSSAVARDLTGI